MLKQQKPANRRLLFLASLRVVAGTKASVERSHAALTLSR
jgi:hypothetical protein